MRDAAKFFEQYKRDLEELIEMPVTAGGSDEIFRDMLANIAQMRRDELDTAEMRLLNTAFKELRHALKVFRPYRKVRKVAAFGSARTPSSHPDYAHAVEFGKKLVKKDWMVITGGASGIMEAAMIGAGAKNSFGLNILLPFEQDANPVIRGTENLMYFKYFFTRKLIFLKESEATALFPGGFGTFDEGFESLTLVQTGKAKPRPILCIDRPGSDYWKAILETFRRGFVDTKLISPTDMLLMRHIQDNGEAVEELARFYSNYDSSRFLKDRYLIRLRQPLSRVQLEALSREFKDILKKGSFERLEHVEEDDVKDPSLFRLVFHFDRAGYSRLRLLIDRLNQEA